MPRVLLLSAPGEDYLADSLFHGLRTVLGADCVDVPRRDHMYADHDRPGELYGRGFTLFARLPELAIDRPRDPIAAAHEFDLVVLADVWRNPRPWVELRTRTLPPATKVIACDGGDGPVLYPYGPTWWRQARPRPLPRVHGRVDATFKRELQPLTARVRYLGLRGGDRALQRLMGEGVRPIGFSIPEEHLATGEEPKTEPLATHLVDPELASLVGRAHDRYAFDREQDYFADLRGARFGSTGKKAGWDALRHYELAASGCVPLFKDLHAKPPTAAPLDLVDGVNAVGYTDAGTALQRIEQMDEETYARLRAGALEWGRRNTTRARALEVLESVGL